MTIVTEINRIKENIANTYTALSEKGATLPTVQNSDNLASTVSTVTGGGTEGDVVYAVNATGASIREGTKVWMNKHVITTEDNVSPYSKSEQRAGADIWAWWYGGIGFFNQRNYVRRVTFNQETKTWTAYDGVYTNWDSGGVLMQDDNYFWRKTIGKSKVIDNVTGALTEVNAMILSKEYAISASSPYYFGKWNSTSNTMGDLSIFTINWGTANAFVDGNILLVANTNTVYNFYDISDLGYIVNIAGGTLSLTDGSFYAVTGCHVGDYVIKWAQSDTHNATNLYIFKIVEGYNLVLAEDLPAELQALQQQKAQVRYNNTTQVLSVGTHDTLRFYQFDNGAFTLINMDLTLPVLDQSALMYYGYLSPDKSSVCIFGESGGDMATYYYYIVNFYRLVNSDNRYYAEPFLLANGQTLMGFATGEFNDDGEYEVRTVLPSTFQLGDEVIKPLSEDSVAEG